jgi:malonyl CoA-acyl carrier protein transacylase
MQRGDEVRHELGNLLSIALANVEGMADGLVSPTPARLEALADALRRARDLLQRDDATS